MEGSVEIIEALSMELYKNEEFVQVVYTDHKGYIALTEKHNISIGDTLRLRLENDYNYEN